MLPLPVLWSLVVISPLQSRDLRLPRLWSVHCPSWLLILVMIVYPTNPTEGCAVDPVGHQPAFPSRLRQSFSCCQDVVGFLLDHSQVLPSTCLWLKAAALPKVIYSLLGTACLEGHKGPGLIITQSGTWLFQSSLKGWLRTVQLLLLPKPASLTLHRYCSREHCPSSKKIK